MLIAFALYLSFQSQKQSQFLPFNNNCTYYKVQTLDKINYYLLIYWDRFQSLFSAHREDCIGRGMAQYFLVLITALTVQLLDSCPYGMLKPCETVSHHSLNQSFEVARNTRATCLPDNLLSFSFGEAAIRNMVERSYQSHVIQNTISLKELRFARKITHDKTAIRIKAQVDTALIFMS